MDDRKWNDDHLNVLSVTGHVTECDMTTSRKVTQCKSVVCEMKGDPSSKSGSWLGGITQTPGKL